MTHITYGTSPLGRRHDDASASLAEVSCQAARGLLPYGEALQDAHRGLAFRLLMSASTRVMRDGDRDPMERAVNAIHDLSRVSIEITPDEKAERAVMLRRCHRDLIAVVLTVTDELVDLAAGGCPWNDWNEARDWLREFVADEKPDQYECDLSEYHERAMMSL